MATRNYEFIVGAETATLPTASDPVADSDFMSLQYAQSNFTHSLANPTAVKAIDADHRSSNQVIYVSSLTAFFYYSSSSTATGDDVTVITPTDGTGRWLVVPSSYALPKSGGTMTGTIVAQNITGQGDITFDPGKGLRVGSLVAGSLINVQRLTSGTSATYTPTSGTRMIEVLMWGGGGGGGSATATTTTLRSGGGGGGAAHHRFLFCDMSSLTGTYTVGSGGTAGAANTGGNAGGSSSFTMDGYTLTAGGGSGGGASGSGSISTVGQGGTAGSATASGTVSSKYVNIYSAPGDTGGDTMSAYLTDGAATTITINILGMGGMGYGGSIGPMQGTISTGAVKSGGMGGFAGNGGDGAYSSRTTTAATGGAGASGFILIFEYA